MILILVLAIYIANVFLNRYLTMLAYKKDKDCLTYDWWYVWFIPFLGNLWCILDVFSAYKDDRNWFSGKEW